MVDDADFQSLNRYRWYTSKGCGTFYALRWVSFFKNGHDSESMHRRLFDLKFRDGKIVDHKDGNGLNNQRNNLRICTSQENAFNRRVKNKSSRFRGICSRRRKDGIIKSWARITHNGKYINLGCFNSEIDAAVAYDNAAKELFGEFAILNFTK